MPIYEYRCNTCRRRIQVFFRSFSAVADARCPQCGGADLNRLPSRVAIVRSETAFEDMLDDPSALENVDYEDPRAVAEWARRMGESAGVEMGSDYDEMIDEIEHGGLSDEGGGFPDGPDFSEDDF